MECPAAPANSGSAPTSTPCWDRTPPPATRPPKPLPPLSREHHRSVRASSPVKARTTVTAERRTASRRTASAGRPGAGRPSARRPSARRPAQDGPAQDGPPPDGAAKDGPAVGRGNSQAGQATSAGHPMARINLTIPLATLLGLAEHPGEAAGFGPIDPALARDLAAQAAGNPGTSWCITVTDPVGHPVAHGCARRGKPKRKPTGRTQPPDAARASARVQHQTDRTPRQAAQTRSIAIRHRRAAQRIRDLAATAAHPYRDRTARATRVTGPGRRPGTHPGQRLRPPPPDHRPRP